VPDYSDPDDGPEAPALSDLLPTRNRWPIVASTLLVGLIILVAIGVALIPTDDHTAIEGRHLAAGLIFAGTYLAVAVGRIPGLGIDRAGIALVGAALMVACGAIPLDEAYKAVDLDTLTLLLGMMVVVAHLRLSGFLSRTTSFITNRVQNPLLLLVSVIGLAGLLSAFLVNDAICLVMTPLIVEMARASQRNPVPYLLAVAMGSNIGSVATITGNPQNMIIGSISHIPYADFAAVLSPVAVVGLILTAILIGLFYRRDLVARSTLPVGLPLTDIDPVMGWRAVAGTVILLGLLFAGQPPAKAAIVIGALLLLTRRIKSQRVYAEIDWSLLLMFAGLFITVSGAERSLLDGDLTASARSLRLDQIPVLSGATAIISNLVSNVPAVLLLKPLVVSLSDQRSAWLTVAMASTLAGNFTLIGSIANLIVVQAAAANGVEVGFWDYFRVGAPLTLLTLAVGTLWLSI
jgi:Na+/H+ antiporter NhaD/arsenite permease-like protein